MLESLSRVLSRISEIQGLLGESPRPNEAFGVELQRCAEDRVPSSSRPMREAPDEEGAAVGDGTGSREPSREATARTRTEASRQSSRGETPASLAPLIEEASSRTGLPEALISAVMETESGYRPDAVSPAGAQGLMQLMPGTARALG